MERSTRYEFTWFPTVSWRAIFAGLFVTLFTYLTLSAVGIAVGSAALPDVIQGKDNLAPVGIGSGVWMVLSMLISLYLGAYCAGRVAGPVSPFAGRVQGIVITSLFFGLLLSQLGSSISMLGKGIGSTIGFAGNTAADLSQNPTIQSTVNQALGGLNLRSSPDQVIRSVTAFLLRGDSEGAKNYLATQAGISRDEADQRINGFLGDFQATAQKAGIQATRAISVAGWTLFGALVLGGFFSLLGGNAGARSLVRHTGDEAVAAEGEFNRMRRRAS